MFSQDESRFGRLTVRRRRLTALGIQLIGPVQHIFEWFDVDGTVAPITGERDCLDLPSLHAAMLPLCMDAFAEAFPWSLNLRLLDNRGGYTAERPMLPANVRLVFWAPACPEFHPSARVWRDLKEALAWLHCAPLDRSSTV